MPGKRGPTLRSQWLGQQLREAREAAKVSLKEAGGYLTLDPGTVSRYESGIIPAKPQDVMALLTLYDVSDEGLRESLDRLSRESWRKGWWDGYLGRLTEQFIDYAWLEERAKSIRSFDALTVPGLLQTQEYAEAVIRVFAATATSERQIEHGVQFRLERQKLLAGDAAPPLTFILDEALIRRPVGGRAVLEAQLRHLGELGREPNIEIRVLPFSAGEHSGQQGAFRLFELPEPFPEVAYAETLAGSIYVESDAVDEFVRAYDQVAEAALSPNESAELIASAAKDLQ